ncbi:MAG: nucleotidyltransferase domain-containing protein [Bacteroidetes bacterium]|nr:nucleotidyltransferase domain-containing protein [Bacteroidota bacterium]MCL6098724.1 nucleotidyltransferase domain-containing protein [Bacteroidota bacterium]
MDRKVIASVKRFAKEVRKEFPVKKIILFGSYANGTEREDSDIDVAVIVDKYNGNIITANGKLFSLVRKIDVRIEPILLETQYDKSGFVRSILRSGKVIFSAN